MDKRNAENLVSSAFNFPLINQIFWINFKYLKNTISINEIAIDEPDFKDFYKRLINIVNLLMKMEKNSCNRSI